MIAITGQYVFRVSVQEEQPVGVVYPDTSRGKVFVPAPGESFTERELFEISELVNTMAFPRPRRNRF